MVAAKQRQQRGVALLVVVMVVALLSAIGLFAARSASLADVASGYDREGLQALSLAEHAGRVAVSQIGIAPHSYIDLMSRSPDQCEVNARINKAGVKVAPCYSIRSEDIQSGLAAGLFAAQSATAAGSLGPALGSGDPTSALEGLFKVELTDAYQMGPPASWNNAASQQHTYRVTLTAFAQVRNVPSVRPDGCVSSSDSAKPTQTQWCCAPSTTLMNANVRAVRLLVAATVTQ